MSNSCNDAEGRCVLRHNMGSPSKKYSADCYAEKRYVGDYKNVSSGLIVSERPGDDNLSHQKCYIVMD